MSETLPYMNSTGLVSKILDKIKEAKTPDRFSQDFLGTVLGFSSGSARPFIPLAKRMNLIGTDGTPTELYRRFRSNDEASKAAMAEAIRHGFAPLYKRNEYAHRMDKHKLEGLIREITGFEENNSALRAMVGTFEQLKKYANFDLAPSSTSSEDDQNSEGGDAAGGAARGGESAEPKVIHRDNGPIRFGYTININLPDTNDITVFNAIFKSMKDHLL